MESTTHSLAAATTSLGRGWAPVPIPRRTKAPEIKGWTEIRFESDKQLEEHFTDSNIGLILGAASNGLVDIDLDCPEAVTLAGSFLPHTAMRHGRASAPTSHYWYVVDRETATAKFKDPTDNSMLVELRSTGAQTVIPPSIHPSGEALEWVGEWGEPRKIGRSELQVRVRIVAAAALLTRHWPASGGRHDATLALAGGLLRAGWSEKNATYFVCEVATAVDPHVDRKDRAAAVATTAARLEQDLETQGWRSLIEFVGPDVVAKVREWLDLTHDDPAEETTEVPNRVDLGALVRDGVPDPEWLIEGLFYRQQIHWWHGEPGDGKTFMLLGLMYRLSEQGGKILWLDEESGQVQTARRLQSFGADPDVLTKQWHYHARPGLSMETADLDALFRLAAEIKPDAVIMDSVSDVLDQAGLDEDVNKDITRWSKQVLEPLKFEYGCTVIAIDHVTKSKDSRGKYARGAGAKKSKADAAWKVVKHKEFGVKRVGLIRLEADKDRDGWLEPKLAWRIGGQGGRTILEQVEAVQAAGGNKAPETELGQRIVEFLRLNAECESDAQPTREVEGAVVGKSAAIRGALRELVADEETGIRLIERGRTHLWWYEDLSDSMEVDFRDIED